MASPIKVGIYHTERQTLSLGYTLSIKSKDRGGLKPPLVSPVTGVLGSLM